MIPQDATKEGDHGNRLKIKSIFGN